MSEKERMDVETFCERYSISRVAFYSHVKKKTIRIIKDGRTFIARKDAEEWLDKQRNPTD